MRLTLRTLLAYMDEILEPEDQQELTKKIETSEFASDLIHRTRDTMRRLRLSAPQVVGTGLGLDPNTVAEYLDNSLPVENVADLERICLESDIHLAEVGSCHHVLTMVLGEPAEIDPSTKQRMYRIGEEAEQRKQLRIEPAHPAPPIAPIEKEPPVTAPSREPVRPASRTEVPDYLRASRRSAIQTGVQVIVAAALLAGVAYLGMGFFSGQSRNVADGSNGLAGSNQPSTTNLRDSGNQPDSGTKEPVVPPVPEEPEPPQPQPPEQESDLIDSSLEQPADGTISREPLIIQKDEPEINNSVEMSNDSGATGEQDLKLDEPPALPNPVNTDPPKDSQDSASREPEEGIAEVDGEGSKAPAIVPPDNTPEVTEPEAPLSKEIGVFWADGAVLLRQNQETGDWFPLASGTPLEVGDRLMSLPTFRPTIALNTGVWVTPSGAAVLELIRDDSEGSSRVPGIRLISGRAILIKTTEDYGDIQVEVGSSSATATIGSGAGIAIEMIRAWYPGFKPMNDSSVVAVNAYAYMGDVLWNDGFDSHVVGDPSRWEIREGVETEIEPFDAAIEWLDEEPAKKSQLMAANEIQKRLQPNVAAGTVFLEMQSNRRREVRKMAAECSAFAGQFAPFIRSLNDSDEEQNWGAHISTMRNALANNPETGGFLIRDLAELRGSKAAADMFEMICGYDREAIGNTPLKTQTGALLTLINHLENDVLDYRVLAVHNLREITGKSLLSDPAGSPSDRAQGVRRWRERLEEGELAPLDTYYR